MQVEQPARDSEGTVDRLNEARLVLDDACRLYCRWYDKGIPGLDGSAMAYELVSACRKALATLPSPTK